MENIDDLMRQKFDSDNPGERFEFQEEYWEQAQVLLEREEDKRRKGWWLFLALLLLITLLGWLLLGKGLDGKGWTQNETNKLTEHSTVQTESPSLHSNANQQTQTADAIQPNTENQPKNTVQQSDANQPINKFGSGLSSVENIENQKIAKESQTTRKDGKAKRTTRNNLTAKKGQDPSATATAARLKENKNDLNTPDAAGTTNPSSTKEPSSNQSPTTNPQLPVTNNQLPVTNNQLPTTNLPIPTGILTVPKREVMLQRIPVAAKEPIAERIKPVDDQRFSMGLSLAGAAYQADASGQWAGWSIGAFGDYRLNKNWSVMLGAQWRFVPGYGAEADSSNPDRVEQLRYSFGFTQEVWKRETRGLHYLEIPLSASWKQKRLGLEAGGAAGMLFLMQNKTTLTTESSLEAAKTTVNKLVKGDPSPYNSLYFNGFVGADYRLTNRISIMARGLYRFTPMFKNTSDGVSNGGLGNVDLGLRFRLF